MDEEEIAYERVQAFKTEFRDLVRKHMPTPPQTHAEADILARMQEKTSCYAAWIWNEP